MPLSARNRMLFVGGLAVLVMLSGRSSAGQAPRDQASGPSGAPPLGLGLGDASYEEVLERIDDRSEGHVAVDPYALHPPALSPDAASGFVWHAPKPYTCWAVGGGHHDEYAPGTAVACYVEVTLADGFVNGDGSLSTASATGKPDDFFGFDCDGFHVMDYTRNRWRAVRYFDRNLNQIGTIRAARYDGLSYNYTTGKSVSMRAHFIEIDTMTPADGTADHEFTTFLGDDYRAVGPHGRVLADSSGRIDYTPLLAEIVYVAGPHPLDFFYAGDASGVQPVCQALR